MSIQSVISGLTPFIYYALGEPAGSTTVHDIGGSLNGSVSGDLQFGVSGPEQDTTALRLFSTGSVVSPALTLTPTQDWSLMMFLSTPATGTVSTPYPIWNIGDPANPVTRGWRFLEQHSVLGSPDFHMQQGASNAPVGGPTPNPTFWHFFCWTWTNSTHTWTRQWDMTTGTGTLGGLTQNWLTTDPMQIKSDEPVVLSHVALFSRVLTSTQINSVGTLVAQWPFTIPINTPLNISTPVDLTPVTTDTSQILANQTIFMPEISNTQTIVEYLQGQWNNYTSVTLPSLNALLDSILGGITSTITGVGGAVGKTLGDLFSGKTWDLLTTFDLGSACHPDVIDQSIGGATFFGIQMECTSHADWYVFTGSADDYTTQALGTLQIFRGGSEILRTGLHTLTHTVYPLPGVPLFEMVTEMPTIPGEYRVVLTPAPETCWTLVALEFP